MEQNNQTQPGQPTQEAPPMFQLIITGEEAGLMLNKLNVAAFTGFKEASMATTIFAKIQSATRVAIAPNPGAVARPPVGPQAVQNPESAGGFTSPPNVEGNVAVEEDNRPTAPLKSINEAKESVQNENTTSVPPPDQDSIFSVVDRSTKGGINVGESDI